uniref:Urea-proton symporter DUR3 isoform X1 n=1 Tax=Rhizophora mucronata TaxID=61149 RepID=A0A2P2LSU8_RHIMU
METEKSPTHPITDQNKLPNRSDVLITSHYQQLQ